MNDEKDKKDDTAEEAVEENKEEASAPAEATADKPAADTKEKPVEEAPAADGADEGAEVPVLSDEGAEVEVPKKFKALVEQVESMTVLELNELVKLLEKKFGVSASAVAVQAPGAGGEAAEEKSEFTVHLASIGDQKIAVIKVVKDVLGLGLKEAKDLVDSAPTDLKTDVKKEQAEEWKTKIEGAGGKVELK